MNDLLIRKNVCLACFVSLSCYIPAFYTVHGVGGGRPGCTLHIATYTKHSLMSPPKSLSGHSSRFFPRLLFYIRFTPTRRPPRPPAPRWRPLSVSSLLCFSPPSSQSQLSLLTESWVCAHHLVFAYFMYGVVDDAASIARLLYSGGDRISYGTALESREGISIYAVS